MNQNLKWVLAALALAVIGGVLGTTVQHSFYNNGGIKAIGVSVTWLNGTAVDTVNWGKLENGSTYILEPLNITNTGEFPVNLTLSTSSPTNIISLSLTWNYAGGTVVAVGGSVIVEITQTLTASGDWSYTTVITATQVS